MVGARRRNPARLNRGLSRCRAADAQISYIGIGPSPILARLRSRDNRISPRIQRCVFLLSI
jgi:hypothetical protein